jgi:hypothetical protein
VTKLNAARYRDADPWQMCQDCGALVWSRRLHDGYHDEVLTAAALNEALQRQ